MGNCVRLTQSMIYANRVEMVSGRGRGLLYCNITVGKKNWEAGFETLFLIILWLHTAANTFKFKHRVKVNFTL